MKENKTVSLIETDYVVDNKKVSYAIFDNGYGIYLGEVVDEVEIKEENGMTIYTPAPWVLQTEPYIPNKNLSYEENAIAQIEEIIATQEASIKAQQEKLEAEQKAEQEKAQLLEQIALQDEAINELASLVSELMMAQESEVE